MTESFHVYILQNEAKNFTYKGMTNDLERRLAEHNRGACQSTKPYRPLKIVYFETYDTRKEARAREIYFKTGSGRRLLKQILSNQ
ncbi:MAG: putative endonuclease [Saprospiraceae bacterium]|jgi:putative endonuclease